MTLREFKKNKRLTTQEVADIFGATHREIYYWMSKDAEIKGRSGQRQIVIKKVVAEENANARV